MEKDKTIESVMNERKRVFLLIGIMGTVALIVGGVVSYMLYQAAFKGQEARLMEIAQSQARMLEAMTRHEVLSHKGNREGWAEAVLEQVKEAHGKYKGMGETGEITLARREGNQMVFLLRHRDQTLDSPEPVPFDSTLAEPMRRALLKKSGTIVGRDYQGIIVLAAYEPVAKLNLGLVAKIDLAEIRDPFIKADAIALGIGIVFIIMGAGLFIKVTRPIIRRLEEHLRQMEIAGNSLRESEERFKKIIQNNADAIVVTTLEGIICFINPAVETLFGRSDRELMGNHIGFSVTGKESVDVQINHPSGAQSSAVMQAVEIEWEGEPSHLISFHDITGRKKAEEGIRHLNKVILAIRNVNQLITKEKDRDRLIRGICENMVSTRGFNGAWIALMDESGAPTHCAEAGIGEPFLTLMEGFEQGKIPQCIQKALTHAGVSIIEDVFDECVDCPLRSAYQDQVAFSTRLEHGGKVYGVLNSSVSRAFGLDEEEKSLFREVGEDIAFALNNFKLEEERRQAEDEREKLEQQLFQSQKLEAIGTLTGGIAHDFNNLLTTIIGNTAMTIAEVGKASPLYEFLEDIREAGERAAGLIKQLLAFSRKQIIQTEVVNLNEMAGNMDRMLQRIIREDIELETLLSPDLGRVEADVGQMEQILMNLAVNARDAMPRGGKLTIETKNVELDEPYNRNHIAVIPGNYVMLAVSDTGIGMTKEVQARIFEPFFTTKEKGKGTGLGLSTVYGIVKQSKGNLWVYSEPGKGTTLKIYLPRVEKTIRIMERPVQKEECLEGSETILVVEDDDLVMKLALKTLKKYGYTVLFAGDGQEAFDICREHKGPVQLLLSDMVMPRMSGRELAKSLEGLMPEVKVLFMSGYTDDAIVHHGILDKGIAFIQKPFRPEDLARKVREVLDKGLTIVDC